MTDQLNLRRKRRIQKISPFNGYQFREHPSLVITNQKNGKELNIYQTKHEHPQFHNFLVNLRNSEKFLKDQHHFENPYLEEVYEGKHTKEAGGFDELNEMVLNKSSLLPKIPKAPNLSKYKIELKPRNQGERANIASKIVKRRSISLNPSKEEPKVTIIEPQRSKRSISTNIFRRGRAFSQDKHRMHLPSYSRNNRSLVHESNLRLYRPKRFRRKLNKSAPLISQQLSKSKSVDKKPSFNQYMSNSLRKISESFLGHSKRSKVNFSKKVQRSGSHNIRRYSNNLEGLNQFVKEPLQVKGYQHPSLLQVLKQHASQRKNRKRLIESQEYGVEMNESWNKFDSDPYQYERAME